MDAVDSKTLEALGGKVTKLTVQSGRKLTDGNWGSLEASFVFEIEVSPDTDPAALAIAGYEFAKALVNQTVVADGMALQAQNAGKTGSKQAQEAPQKASGAAGYQKAHQEPTRTPAGAEDKEFRTVDAEYFEVEVGADNIRKAKVFGGPYKKFGVRCYPEPLEAVGIDVAILEAGKFAMPDGFTKMKVVLNEQGNPKKVWSLKA
jgi:uncharacterized protein Veg